jgi:hypothetical protein
MEDSNLIINNKNKDKYGIVFLNGFRDINTTSVIIPSEITNIGAENQILTRYGWVFNETGCENFDNLTSIDIPATVKVIAQNAFKRAKKLTSVNITSTNISINRKSFLGCISLTELIINGGQCTIGQNAFSGCTSLTKITINSICNIRPDAFLGCTSLNTITVTVDSNIHNEAFSGCTSLKYLNIIDGDRYYSYQKTDVPEKDEHKRIMSNIFKELINSNIEIDLLYEPQPPPAKKQRTADGKRKRRSNKSKRSNKKSQRRSKRRSNRK